MGNGESRDRPGSVSEPGLGKTGPAGAGPPRRVPAEIRDASFSVSARGYDRRSVDAYVIRVNRLIAELEATRSPGAVLRHAFEDAKGQSDGIIEQARETAAEITDGAWREAEEIAARARAEAADIVVNADAEADHARAAADTYVAKAADEAKVILAGSEKEAAERFQRSKNEIAELWEEAETSLRELRAEAEALWVERRALLDDVREIAARLEEAARSAATRFSSGEPAESRLEAVLGSAAAAAAEQSGAAADPESDAGIARRGQRPPGEKREVTDTGPTQQPQKQ